MKKLLTVSLIILLISGCRSELRIWTKLTQLDSDIPVTTYVPLMITLPECQATGDASRPSVSLRQMQMLLNELFQGVNYQDCHIRGAEYKATFLVRVDMGSIDAFNGKYEPGIIYLMGNNLTKDAKVKNKKNKYANNGALLIGLSTATKNSILRQKKRRGRNMLTSESKLIIYLENNRKSVLDNLMGSLVYINNNPILTENTHLNELKNGRSMSIQLSDVFADSFLVGKNETYTILSLAK